MKYKLLLASLLFSGSVSAAPLIFEELWTGDNSAAGLTARGWTDGVNSSGNGYKFETDSVLKKNVMYIHWNSSDPQPNGASSLQKAITGTENGATMHVGYKSHNFHNRAGTQAHYVRFLQNWTEKWGGMGPAVNQMNFEVGGGANPWNVWGTNGNMKDVNATKSFFYAGGTYGSYAAYKNPSPTGYLQDGVWYEFRAYMKPQAVKGENTGTLLVDYKKVADASWTRIIEANNVQLTDTSGLITKFVIGPYHNNPVPDTRIYVGWVRVYAGDAISDGTITGFMPAVTTPVVNPPVFACPTGWTEFKACIPK